MKRMGQHRRMRAPEERARITELQDLLIERFVEALRKQVALTSLQAEWPLRHWPMAAGPEQPLGA
jgi:hypothetical protein